MEKEKNKTIDFDHRKGASYECEHEFIIEYNVSGRYIPASRYEPEEHPEMEMLKVYLVSKSGEKMREVGDFDYPSYESLEEACWDDHEGRAEAQYEAHWERKFEESREER